MSSGQGQHDRPGPARRRDVEGAGDELGNPVGALDLRHPLRHRPEHLPIVDLLECLALHHRPADLADQKYQRRRILVGGVDPTRRVRRSGASRDHADSGAARELPVRVGHVCGTHFVAARDEADRCVVERVEHGQVALTRNTERNVDAVDDELVDDELPAGSHLRWMGCSK